MSSALCRRTTSLDKLKLNFPPAIRFVFTIWNGHCVTSCAAAAAMFAEVLCVGYFPMIAGHGNRMDDCHYVFQVNIEQNFSELQMVQPLANIFRLFYNVLMKHLLSWRDVEWFSHLHSTTTMMKCLYPFD